MKRISREIKIGAAFIVALALLYFGINFMKGSNVFSRYNTYYTVLKHSGGLASSSAITVNGYQVGTVSNVAYDYTAPNRIVVTLRVAESLRLPKGSRAVVVSSMMDGSSISLKLAQGTEYYADGDTIGNGVANGMMAEVENVMLPQINAMIPKVDSLITALTTLVSNPSLTNSLSNVERISSKLDYTVDELNRVFHSELPQLMNSLQGTADNMDNITSDLATIDFAQTMERVDSTLASMQALSAALMSDQSSVGRLLNDTAFYSNLNGVCTNANALIEDVKAHPARYINISVFGKKSK
ncbi:MAG: MCE family protein [Bacteroidaceae bacterium]|nr:MCE family protein [Bacteroidaceae bacterium]